MMTRSLRTSTALATLTKTIAIAGAGQREVYVYWTVADLLDVSRPLEAPPAFWTTPSAPKC